MNAAATEKIQTHLPGLGPVLELCHLTKTYDSGVSAVKELSFSVGRGEVFGLLGPNGAGKSTTLSMLSGTTTATSGQAFVRGVSLVGSRAVRRQVGVAFQDSVLDTEFTGRENLRLHARLWSMTKTDASTRIAELLAFMGLTSRADDNVRTYSGGMKRRLELARAVLARPALVLLDEPTVGLDPAVRDEIWTLVSRMRAEEGTSIVVSTHYLEEAEAACDRVGIMSDGQMVGVGSPAELIGQFGRETIEVHVAGEVTALRLPSAFDGWVARSKVGVVTLSGDAGPQTGDSSTAGVEPRLDDLLQSIRDAGHTVTRAALRKTTLADVFANLTTSSAHLAVTLVNVPEQNGQAAA